MSEKNSTKSRTIKFALVGSFLALANFAIYTFLARVIFSSNELLWLDSLISYLLATFLAYFMHSRITWKERHPGQFGVIKFFLWNFLTALLISPFFTWLFKLITPFYEFIFNISTAIHLPFDFNFIESTGVFVLTTCVTMILNYFFYDKLVFGTAKPTTTNTEIKGSPKVSVVVPIYNTSKYLPKCLDSIINQSYQNLEIILIDDGSTDNSGKIADDYAKKDKRIKVFHQKNAGQSAARNLGLEKATGDYVGFIDSDDRVDKSFILKLLAPYENNSQTLITVCGVHYKRLKTNSAEDVYINPLRPIKKHESKKAYLLYLLAIDGRMYSSVNKLYRLDTAKKCHFDKTLKFAEDTKFVLDYLKKSSGNIHFVLEPLYIYNFGTETSTINNTATTWKSWQTAYTNLKSWLGPHPKLSESFWLHIVHLRWRISFIRSRRRAAAK